MVSIKLYHMTWYTGTCGIMIMSLLLYNLTLWSKRFIIMLGIGSNGCYVTDAPCWNRGHSYKFASSVGHPRSDSVGLLVYDGMSTISEVQMLYYSWANTKTRPDFHRSIAKPRPDHLWNSNF